MFLIDLTEEEYNYFKDFVAVIVSPAKLRMFVRKDKRIRVLKDSIVYSKDFIMTEKLLITEQSFLFKIQDFLKNNYHCAINMSSIYTELIVKIDNSYYYRPSFNW